MDLAFVGHPQLAVSNDCDQWGGNAPMGCLTGRNLDMAKPAKGRPSPSPVQTMNRYIKEEELGIKIE
ncbi:MAG: hypothetical protein PHU33_17475 [Bacteroidales bacterium]|nr:hypothetical protein [Bacteroidales bacterium]